MTYIAGERALVELRKRVRIFLDSKERPHVHSCEVLDALQILKNDLVIPQSTNDNDALLDTILYGCYDSRIEDENTRTGGNNVIHGYAGCAYPLVLSHNCPNNSIYLLWAQTEATDGRPGLRALFPRISRHLEGR